MRKWGAWIVVAMMAASPAWAARDMCKLLKDKGVLDDVEFNECKAAQEKEDTQVDTKAKEAIALRLPKWFDALSLFGDLRNRYEGFYANDLKARNRFRMRARLGLNVNLGEELSGTFRLATGNPDDPISRNQSYERTFTQKPFALDQAFMTLKPGKTLGIEPGWVTVVAGKFSTNAYRVSELLWDDDLTPEGSTQIFNFYEQKEGMLRGVRLNTFQWIVDEVSNNNDPWMGGAQAVADVSFGGTANWSLGLADFHWENLNTVAQRYLSPFNAGSSPTAAFSTNSNRNTQLANSNSVILAADPTDPKKSRITGFRSRFNILNATSELNFTNPIGLGVPGGVFIDYAYNTQADTKNQGFYAGAGLGKTGKGWYGNSLKNAGDWATTYTFAWVEKDAAVSMFNYSDIDDVHPNATQKGATNLLAHILRFDYALFANLQLTAKAHFINALDLKSATTTTGSSLGHVGNPTVVRTQLDAVLKF